MYEKITRRIYGCAYRRDSTAQRLCELEKLESDEVGVKRIIK